MSNRKPTRPRRVSPNSRRRRIRRKFAVVAGTLVVTVFMLYAAHQMRRGAWPHDEGHEHRPAPHGGTVVPLGDGDEHGHAEAILGGGVLKLYVLGADASAPREVESQFLTAAVRPEGESGAAAVLLRPMPRRGDGPGKTSRFAGRLPAELWGKPLVVTVPNIDIAGRRFPLEFGPVPARGGAPDSDEERRLYLRPGGLYDPSDIEANGRVTASQKFKDFKPSHDPRPEPGARVCPVTRTRPNPKCTWVVGGRTYEFCCPPCIDDFVRTAKERPDEVRTPAEYVWGQ